MAFSKPLALLLISFMATAAMSDATGTGSSNCPRSRKITLQNLSGGDLRPVSEPDHYSEQLLAPGFLLRHGTHAEFPVCGWTGRVSVPDKGSDMAAVLHIAGDGGAWYQTSNHQAGPGGVRVTVTPHAVGNGGLRGHCPTVGCAEHGRCTADAVAGSDCGNVEELKVVYYPAY